METTATPQTRSPILPLTSARFFAAAYVVLLHIAFWNGTVSNATWAGRFFRNGYVAVGFFFVLSGYILAHVYVHEDRPVQRRKFWISRFARVYPLLIVSLLIDAPRFFFVKLQFYGSGAWIKALAHTLLVLAGEASLLHAWLGNRLLWINGPAWSLSDEAFFYAVFPFVVLAITRWGRKIGWLTIVGFWACEMFIPAWVTWRHPEMFVQVETSRLQWVLMLTPVVRVFEFMAGIALCSVQREFMANVSARGRNKVGYFAIGIAGVAFVAVIQYATRIPFLMMFDGFLLPVFALTIFGLVNIRGWLAALLSYRFMVLLGEASFAMYLLHWPIYGFMVSLRPITSLEMCIAYWAVLMVLSIFSLFFLERPARRWILSKLEIRAPSFPVPERVTPLSPN